MLTSPLQSYTVESPGIKVLKMPDMELPRCSGFAAAINVIAAHLLCSPPILLASY